MNADATAGMTSQGNLTPRYYASPLGGTNNDLWPNNRARTSVLKLPGT